MSNRPDQEPNRRRREEEKYQLETASSTLKLGRLGASIGIVVLSTFIYLDFTVLGFPQMLPVRLVGIIPLALFLFGSFTLLPRKLEWVVGAYSFALGAIMAEGAMVAFWVFSVRPDNPGWQTDGTGALFISVLGVFVLAGGARKYLLLITGAPLGLLLGAFTIYQVLRPSEWTLFIDPVVAAVLTVAVGLMQEGLARREFAMRWLAQARKTELEAEVAKHKNTLYQLQRQSIELRTSNDDLDQFANTISHDLRVVLRVVAGFLGVIQQRLEKGDPDPDELRGFIEQTVDGSKRMDRMISDLLSYARVGTRGRTFRAVDLEKVVADARKGLAMAIRESGAEIEVESPLPRVIGDSSQLLQLLQNLLSNAIKYRRPDKPPRVRLSTERVESEVRISVQDDGIGIPAKHHGEIFDVLRRLHTREEYDGTGMGLAICKKIVDRHGGRLEVSSSPGEGATFVVILAAGPAAKGED